MFGSNVRGFVSQDAALQDKSSLHGSEEQDSGDSGAEEEFEILGQEEIKEHRHSED